MTQTAKRLILTRHAKSSWDDPALDDHERPLNKRGRQAATALGEWLGSRGFVPDQVLCSDAARTVETWAGVAKALTNVPDPEYLSRLYHAPPDLMLELLRKARGGTVMVLGHNPGMAAFAALLVAAAPSHPDFSRYPTAATLVVDFYLNDWSEVAPGLGSAHDFFVPGDGD